MLPESTGPLLGAEPARPGLRSVLGEGQGVEGDAWWVVGERFDARSATGEERQDAEKVRWVRLVPLDRSLDLHVEVEVLAAAVASPVAVIELESLPDGPERLDPRAVAPDSVHRPEDDGTGRRALSLRTGRRTRSLLLVLEPGTKVGRWSVRELEGVERARLTQAELASTSSVHAERTPTLRARIGPFYDELLFAPTDSRYGFELAASGEPAVLRTSYGVLLDALGRADGEPVTFRVLLERDGVVEELFSDTIRPSRGRESAPRHAVVELGRLPEVPSKLWLETSADPRAADPVALAAFGHPVLEIGEPPDVPMPGLIVVSIDTLRADHLGCQGDPRGLTPVLDALAAESVRFENASSQVSFTLPSHTSMMSGQYPSVHGVIEQGIQRDPRVTRFVAQAAREAGYRTAAFTGGLQLSETMGLEAGFECYHVRDAIQHDQLEDLDAWLDEIGDTPSFLFLHTYAAHAYDPPEEILSELHPSCESRLHGVDLVSQIRSVRRSHEVADREHVAAVYAASVRFADRQVGRVLDRLRARGLLDRMPLIVTSDHGEELFDHGDFGHGSTLYLEQLHVPLLLRPAGGGAPRVVPRLVELVDVHPTALELLGLSFGGDPSFQAGRSLLPFLEPGRDPADDAGAEAFAELLSRGLAAMRGVDWTLIAQYESAGPREDVAYALGEDPRERAPLAEDDPRRAAAVRRFEEMQDSVWKVRDRAAPMTRASKLDPDLVRRLEAGGYVLRDDSDR